MYSRLQGTPERSFFLFGPRGTGKTAWLRQRLPKALTFDLLLADEYRRLSAAPQRLREAIPERFDGWVVIDEVQRVPDLLDEVHALIEGRKLRFALTSSSARKLRRGGANLLAGRARTLHMHPLTALELGRDFDLGRALRVGTLPFACTTKDPDAYLRDYVATFEVKRSARVRDEDLAPLQAFGDEYPVAKRFLLHTGKERRHQGGVEIVPVERLLHSLDRLLADGELPT